jgi:hypothetical protein
MKTQAWGWLAVGVLAAGLNASYHEGGLRWAHEVADRVEHSSAAVLALANGHVDQFLAESRLVTSHDETASCRWATSLARVQTGVARSETGFAHFEAMSAREQAQLARWEADRGRIEARVAARMARVRIPAVTVSPVSFRTVNIPSICPRVRVSVPSPPVVRIPDPVIEVEAMGAGPI